MPGREFDACRRHQIHEGIVRLGAVGVHGIHHFLRGMGAGNGQHAGVHLFHHVVAILPSARAQAAGNDDLAVFGQGFADGVEALFHGIVDEAAGIDDDQVCARKGFAGFIAFGRELGQDQFRIGQGLGTPQADKTDFWGRCFGRSLRINHCRISGSGSQALPGAFAICTIFLIAHKGIAPRAP